MSAIRSTNKRRSNRSAISSPYARPAPKKSSWSLFGLLSYLNPLKSRSSEPEAESESSSDTEQDVSYTAEEAPEAPPRTLSARGKEIQSSLNRNGRPNTHGTLSSPPSQPPAFTFGQSPSTPTSLPSASRPSHASLSPERNMEVVTAYLSERRKGMSEVEVDGLISLLQQTTPAPKSEPFRFSTSVSDRSKSPMVQSTSLPSVSATTPRKTLTRNPNGVYRWEGGGSAKRLRNRYHSPAFGPSRSTPDRLKLSTPAGEVPPVPRMDTKRRRVGDDATTSTTSPSGSTPAGYPIHTKTPSPPPRASAPAPSPTRAAQAYTFPTFNGPLSPSPTANGTSSQANGSATTPTRLRIPQKPTAPAIPSPLRQTWNQQGDGSPPQSGSSQSQPPQQTMAANFMAELIKDVTPPKRPDVSNPYQTASPVKPSAKPKPKRPRATGRPAPPSNKIELASDSNKSDTPQKPERPLSEYSPQAIIEATLPKGSKRSRPTPNGNGASLVTDDDALMDERSSKRSKDGDAEGLTSQKTIPIIRLEPAQDVSMTPVQQDLTAKKELPAVTTSNKPLFGAPKASSIPKEPSKLRFSYQPDGSPEGSPASKADVPPTPKLAPAQIPAMPLFATSSAPAPHPELSKAKESSNLLGLGLPSSFGSRPSGSSSAQPKLAGDPKATALNVPKDNLPTFPFIFGSKSSVTGDSAAKRVALNIPKEELPNFTFTVGKPSGAGEGSKAPQPPSQPPTPSSSFNWAAAGIKPSTSSGSNWTCSTCLLSNPATATEKCPVCDAPRSAPVAAPPKKAFDWSAAGAKPPTPGVGSNWNCSMCMLSNPATATEKCTVCDTPRP